MTSAIRTTPNPLPSIASSLPRTVSMASSRRRFVSLTPTTFASITYTKTTCNCSCCIPTPSGNTDTEVVEPLEDKGALGYVRCAVLVDPGRVLLVPAWLEEAVPAIGVQGRPPSEEARFTPRDGQRTIQERPAATFPPLPAPEIARLGAMREEVALLLAKARNRSASIRLAGRPKR